MTSNRDNKVLGEHPPAMKSVLLFLLLTGAHTSLSSGNEVVTFAIGEYPPYTSALNPDARVLENLVTAVFKEQSINVEYKHYPWKRSIALARNGDVDGTFPWPKTSDRLRDFHFSDEAVYQDQLVFWHLRSTPFDWNIAEDLREYKFGVTVGYTRTHEFLKSLGIKVDTAVSEVSNFKKLLAGRIDVYRTSRVVGTFHVDNLFGAASRRRFVFHPKISDNSDFFLLFSRKTDRGKQLKKEYSMGLKKLKESGRYQDLIHELDHYRKKSMSEQEY